MQKSNNCSSQLKNLRHKIYEWKFRCKQGVKLKSHYGCMAEQNLERLSIAEKVTYKGTRLCSVQKIETFTRRSEPTRLVLETSKLAERILVSAPNFMSESWTLKKYVLPSAF